MLTATVRQGIHTIMGGLEFVTAATRTFGANGIICTDRARAFPLFFLLAWSFCSFAWTFILGFLALTFLLFVDARTSFSWVGEH